MTEHTDDPLLAYGWDAAWAEALHAHAPADTLPARVARVDRGACSAIAADGSHRVQLLPRTDWPVTGDWIALRPAVSEQELATLEAILPRRSELRRMDADERRAQVVAANVDVVLAVLPLDRPFKPGLRDRVLVLASDAGARAVLVHSKTDLASPEQLAAVAEQDEHGCATVAASAAHGQGVAELRQHIGGGTAVLLGPSGAGKSTLANALIGEQVQRTGAVREGDRKGRHTTTARELIALPGGGVLIDTPGVRALGLWDAVEGIDEVFDDIVELAGQCRFTDCAHDTEPDCAVLQAIEDGRLTAERLERWRTLAAEAEAAERRRSEHEQRAHDRQFARVVRDAQRRKGRRD